MSEIAVAETARIMERLDNFNRPVEPIASIKIGSRKAIPSHSQTRANLKIL